MEAPRHRYRLPPPLSVCWRAEEASATGLDGLGLLADAAALALAAGLAAGAGLAGAAFFAGGSSAAGGAFRFSALREARSRLSGTGVGADFFFGGGGVALAAGFFACERACARNRAFLSRRGYPLI